MCELNYECHVVNKTFSSQFTSDCHIYYRHNIVTNVTPPCLCQPGLDQIYASRYTVLIAACLLIISSHPLSSQSHCPNLFLLSLTCDDSFDVGPNLLSCKSVMTQITHLTILAFTFGAISGIIFDEIKLFREKIIPFSAAQPLGFIADILNLGSPKLEWKRVEQGNIPRDAIKLRPFSSLVHHYCRVTQVF